MTPTIQRGLITELQCQFDFSKYGILLSQPIINDSRYDYIADINGKLYRIQCKSATVNETQTAISFPTSNHNWNTGKVKSYKGQIDYFYTCYNNIGYLIPIEEADTNKYKTLRFKAAINYKNENITWAKDYEFDKIIKTLIGDEVSIINFNSVRKDSKSINYCIDCNAIISYGATRCVECNKKYLATRKNNESKVPGREELKELIRTTPFTTIGKQFGVTDNSVRKWCKKMNLPHLKREIDTYSDEEWEKI